MRSEKKRRVSEVTYSAESQRSLDLDDSLLIPETYYRELRVGTGSQQVKIYEQVAAIPYRRADSKVEFLLITSLKKGRWIVPKGLVEEHLTAEESAALEAYEEAGVRGRISAKPVGSYEYRKWGGTCSVRVFTLEVQEVLDRWPEGSLRERKWVSPNEAEKLVEPAALKAVLQKAQALIGEAE